MAVNHQDKGDIPSLASIFVRAWPKDTKEDLDCPAESDSGGSSEEWDGVSESSLSSAHFSHENNKSGSEDRESDADGEGDGAANGSVRYAQNLCPSPLLSHYIAVKFNCLRTISIC